MTTVTSMWVLTLSGFAGEPLDPARPDGGNAEWRMRHGERVAEVRSDANNFEVLFIGDSITSGWRDIGKALWEKEFAPLHAVNIGIAGSQTSHILWQFENGAIDGIHPHVAVLMIGVNNVMASPTQSAAEVARGVSTIVAKLRAKLPDTKILLLGTFPKDKEPSTPDRRKIQELNSIIAKLDDGMSLRYLDISNRLLDKDGTLTADVSPDGVHLTVKGYQTWADAMLPLLREMRIDHSNVTGGGQTSPDAAGTWEMGPFVKRDKPVLSPTPDSKFQCPILGKEVRWEEQNVYNPAAVVKDGKVYLLYRADDKNPDLKWGRTCRIGLASSDDGINFTRHPTPVLYPDNDEWKKYEWEGGCEDLHVVEGEDGTYYMNYTTWNGGSDTMSVATSRDLIHWTKHGPAFRKATPNNIGGRSGVVISQLAGERLSAAKINGKYWMYYTHPCALAWSDNLIDWTRAGKSVWGGDHEAGAIGLLRDHDIVLMFNTQGYGNGWSLGQALIDRNNMTSVLKESSAPFLYPELEWEKKGFTEPATVANTLVPFKGRWLLYYGAADRCIGLATCANPGSSGGASAARPDSATIHWRPAPPGLFGDPNPFFWKGEYHVFYLLPDKGSYVWEHIVSKDLVHWRELPRALEPGKKGEPDEWNAASGSVVEKDGTFHIFYVGFNSGHPNGRQQVMHATSPDLTKWTKHLEDTFVGDGVTYWSKAKSPPPQGDPDESFRDPYVR